MKQHEYEAYKNSVAAFFKRYNLNNLTRTDNNEEPFFSWKPCACCRRPLGGNRITASGYSPITKNVHTCEICLDCEYYAEYGRLDDLTMLDLENNA